MLNDKDMDVLMGRYAKSAAQGTPVEHPDADELNAFAEGALPPATRQRYLSHFADCDDCRKLVSQLAVTTGAGVETRIPASEPVAEPWWKKLGAVFAVPTLRYAALAFVVLVVGGIAFVAWRQPVQQNTDLVAQNQPQTNPGEGVKPQLSQETEALREQTTERYADTAIAQPSVSPASEQNRSGLTTSEPPPPPPKPVDALAAEKGTAPVVIDTPRADDASRTQTSPYYSPPPPTETYRMESRERAQQTPGAIPGGPRRNESADRYKTADRAGVFAKARDEEDDRAAKNQPSTENKKDASKSAQPSSQVAAASPQSAGELAILARKSEGAGVGSVEATTRSVGGRKFKRQGNAWVDAKLKSSMSIRTVSRGSEEFEKLDSGLRSIASQLSGEIVVVWKGKAYRIR